MNFYQASNLDISKPNPQLFLRACQALLVQPNQTLMVGDSQADIEMAVSAGAAGTIGVNRTCNPKHLALADVQIASLTEIQIMKSSNSGSSV